MTPARIVELSAWLARTAEATRTEAKAHQSPKVRKELTELTLMYVDAATALAELAESRSPAVDMSYVDLCR
jgi:hypothetical protein